MNEKRKPKLADDSVELFDGTTVGQVKTRFFGISNQKWFETEIKIMESVTLEKARARNYRQLSQLYFLASDVIIEFAYAQRKNIEVTNFLNNPRALRAVRKSIVDYVQTELNREGATIHFDV